MPIPYDECLHRLRAQAGQGKPIIGTGAGTGLSAKCAEAADIGWPAVGRYRA